MYSASRSAEDLNTMSRFHCWRLLALRSGCHRTRIGRGQPRSAARQRTAGPGRAEPPLPSIARFCTGGTKKGWRATDVLTCMTFPRDQLAAAAASLKLRRDTWTTNIRLARARIRRRSLDSVTFVSVTGSTGKTITKDLVRAVLATRGPCTSNRDGWNLRDEIARVILRTGPDTRYCVLETATRTPGQIARYARMIRPRIGVVTNVGRDHWSAFGSAEAIAEEKGSLVEMLPPGGVAILNADDPLVRGMASRFAGRSLMYGEAEDAAVRALSFSGHWPDRLSLMVQHDNETVRVDTRLCGHHWRHAVLAALAVGVAEGIPLNLAADAISRIEPTPGRMSVEEHRDGVTFIRDDAKASLPSVAPALAFLRSARADRKIAVLGWISDIPGNVNRWLERTARTAREAADLVIFVGQRSSIALRARHSPTDRSILAFPSLIDVQKYLEEHLRPGDLVLLKGTNAMDHLVRLELARKREVACWRADCRRPYFCNQCDLLTRPFVEPGSTVALPEASEPELGPSIIAPGSDTNDATLVVGLGNEGSRYRDTPHNAGRMAVDALAATMNAQWVDEDGVMVARASHKGRLLCLVKFPVPINATGAALKGFSARLAWQPSHCVLVFDDVDTPLGRVRQRMKGSSGGHHGVESVLQVFQSEAFGRVKIGVRPGEGPRPGPEYLLAPLSVQDRLLMAEACRDAAAKILELVDRQTQHLPLGTGA